MKFWRSFLSAAVAALILASCAGPSPEETGAPESGSPDAVTFTDALGYETTIESWDRVVSLYGSFAETWLLAGGTLVGTTSDAIEERQLDLDGAAVVGTVKEPNLEEIASRLELPVEEVSQALDAVSAPVSLYDPMYSDGGDPLTVMDQVMDNRNTELNWMEHIALRSAFRTLNDREKQILSLRFYDGKTQIEVANVLGISQAQVSRLEKGAIGTMRKSVM